MIVYLGLPMYGGAHGLTVSCLLQLQKHLLAQGHEVISDIVAGGSIITKVRNGIVKRFIDSKADVLVFIDADMTFEPQDVVKLIDAPFDVSVLNYRARNNNVTWMAQPIEENGELVGIQNGTDIWLQTKRAGTGIMAIRRQTIEELSLRYSDLVYDDNCVKTLALFDFQLQNGQYYGEDYTFCKRLEAIGGQIFILANAYTGHVGDTVYGGNYHEHLQG